MLLLSRTNSIAVEHTVRSRLHSVFFEAGKSFAAPSCLGENIYLATFTSQKSVEGVFESDHGKKEYILTNIESNHLSFSKNIISACINNITTVL